MRILTLSRIVRWDRGWKIIITGGRWGVKSIAKNIARNITTVDLALMVALVPGQSLKQVCNRFVA
jgi:hypothetical protein